MGKICFDGLLRPAGWTRLPSVRRITDLLDSNQNINFIYFEPVYYAHPMSGYVANYPSISFSYDPHETINGEGKPTVGIINGGHAVTLVKEENSEFVFKNSYGPNHPVHPAEIRIPTCVPPGTRTDFKRFIFRKYQCLTPRLSRVYVVLYNRKLIAKVIDMFFLDCQNFGTS